MTHSPSDLTDAEWVILAPLLPLPEHPGRPRTWSLRLILDGIFYSLRTGCAWRYLPDPSRPGKPSSITSVSGAFQACGEH
ncbi:putative transposase of IS4/5 family DUF4096 [Deinococcus yavapaiensis KR-236]|uniref:Putative transposase of IS4/5 family DUF4096 n=1 Tax=Deinococcus yavapaiensis KR-236 TaxID=694435 RepID=A0A318S886_9DEIO|nr:putative transposase of IS4/5 family DUF4096 [Deinococcus yavapaiensis KR-236]